MRKYFAFFTMRFKAGLQYRTAAWAGIATQFVWGGMRILLFYILYNNNPEAFPMDFADFCTYIWLQQAFWALFNTFMVDDETLESIVSGGVAYDLCRPADIYFMWLSKDMATRVSRVILRFPIVIGIALFIPAPFGLQLPAGGLLTLISFIISLILGAFVITSFTMLIYAFSFFTISPAGVRLMFLCTLELLMGQLIPIAFFPDNLQKLLKVLPFASIQNTPLMIYCGEIAGGEILYSLILQLLWIAVLVGVGKLIISRGIKKTVIQGG